MKVLDFIRSNEYWEEALAAAPYHIKATWSGEYVILKYNQLASDFNNEIVRECRGCIMWIPQGRNEWADVVCYPFDKFGNYGESYVPNINWNNAVVKEKVDGSLMKLWWHNGQWHISTNGTVDARTAPTSVEGVSFYDVFMGVLEKNGNPASFFQSLDQDYTYMFELVSPTTRVTIDYPEAAIYYLGARNMITLTEVDFPSGTVDRLFFPFVKLPAIYPLNTLEDCIAVVNKMGADEEGFVVCDNQYKRVKIKSPEYLIASHIRNNNTITVRRVIEAMRAGYIDDFYAYAPDHREFVDKVLSEYNYIASLCEASYALVLNAHSADALPWHAIVKLTAPAACQDYCFRRHADRVKDAYDYLDRQSISHLVDWIKEYMKDC